MDIIAEANKVIGQIELNIKREQEAEDLFATFVSAGHTIYKLYNKSEPLKVMYTSMLETFCEKGYKVEKDKFVDYYSKAIAKVNSQINCSMDEKEIKQLLTMYFKYSIWGNAIK